MDYGEITTLILSVLMSIIAASISMRMGYRRGMQDAAGQIRQNFAIEIAKLRGRKMLMFKGDELSVGNDHEP